MGSIAISATDELYYTDRYEHGALRRWKPSGFSWNSAGYSETIVDNLPFAESIVFGLNGALYLTQMEQEQVLIIDVTNGTVSTFKDNVCGNNPCFLAIDPEGDIWVRGQNLLSQFTPDGVEKSFVVDCKVYTGGYYDLWHTGAGIAFDDEGGEFVPGRFIKTRVTITSRGCPFSCPWCFVPGREAQYQGIANHAGQGQGVLLM